jgi:hypothetical protein
MASEEPALSAASTCVQSSTSPRIFPKPVEEAGGGWRLWLNSMSSTSASMAWGEKSLATTDVACRLAANAGSPKPQPNCIGYTGCCGSGESIQCPPPPSHAKPVLPPPPGDAACSRRGRWESTQGRRC